MMSENKAQDSSERATSTGETSRGTAITVISFYTKLLVFALLVLIALYSYPVVFLGSFKYFLEPLGGADAIALITRLLAALSTPFAILLGWLLAGLCVCGLLYLWLRFQRARAVVALALAVIWIVDIFRYARGIAAPETLGYLQACGPLSILVSPPIVLSILAIGILLLPVAWFLRPMESRRSRGNILMRNPLLTILTSGWLLFWLVFVLGFRGYQGGMLLAVCLVVGGGFFLVGLYLTSGFLLPVIEKGHRGRIFGFLRDCALGVNFPALVVVDEPFEEDKLEKRVPGNLYAGGDLTGLSPVGPGFILTDCNHAVAISDGIEFKGVREPGLVFIGYAEQAVQTIDLRPQLRNFPVETLTTDGIKIRVLAFAPCQIATHGRQPRPGEPLPYNKSAARRAVYAQRMEHTSTSGMDHLKWHGLSQVFGERILQNIISKYDFDALYGPEQPGGKPLRKLIAQTFREQLTSELRPLGIQLVGGGISDLEPADPHVYLERVRSWQARWERRITLEQAKGQTQWLRIVERARAEARTDLILSLGRQLEELSAVRTELRPGEALSLLVSVLEGLTSQHPGMRLPVETLEALSEIRKAISE